MRGRPRVFLLSGVTFAVLAVLLATPAAPLKVSTWTNTQNQTSAAELFGKHCATCHGKDGQAKTFKAKFNHARNLTDPTWQNTVTDERIFNSINRGKGKMPTFGKKLSEAEIDSLVPYVRSLKK